MSFHLSNAHLHQAEEYLIKQLRQEFEGFKYFVKVDYNNGVLAFRRLEIKPAKAQKLQQKLQEGKYGIYQSHEGKKEVAVKGLKQLPIRKVVKEKTEKKTTQPASPATPKSETASIEAKELDANALGFVTKAIESYKEVVEDFAKKEKEDRRHDTKKLKADRKAMTPTPSALATPVSTSRKADQARSAEQKRNIEKKQRELAIEEEQRVERVSRRRSKLRRIIQEDYEQSDIRDAQLKQESVQKEVRRPHPRSS